ncbi:hypothetical protein Q670_02945 [Alcanivorax sp. P2S70]|nr:hypothetical protein Q670_02945 [Alcanivorax sp. P2S70]
MAKDVLVVYLAGKDARSASRTHDFPFSPLPLCRDF